MADVTHRFTLPLLAAGQAQKEVFHNEALALLDMIVHPAVEAIGPDMPPPDPAAGQAWIVGAAPQGAWAGRAHALAAWTPGGWRFAAPQHGLRVWSLADGVEARWTGSGWALGQLDARTLRVAGLAVVGERQPAIAAAAGGATVDAEARSAVDQILAALRAHGLIAP